MELGRLVSDAYIYNDIEFEGDLRADVSQDPKNRHQ